MSRATILAAQSAPVTDWGPRLLLTLGVLAVIGLGIWGMWHGWRARERRQSDLPSLPEPPAEAVVGAGPAVAGTYVATTTAGDLLDRVVVHGLGLRGRAALTVSDAGILIARTGEVDLWIPRDQLRDVRLGSGQAQKAYEAGGLILVSWQWGDRIVDTGFRADDPDQHIATASALAALVPTPGGPR